MGTVELQAGFIASAVGRRAALVTGFSTNAICLVLASSRPERRSGRADARRDRRRPGRLRAAAAGRGRRIVHHQHARAGAQYVLVVGVRRHAGRPRDRRVHRRPARRSSPVLPRRRDERPRPARSRRRDDTAARASSSLVSRAERSAGQWIRRPPLRREHVVLQHQRSVVDVSPTADGTAWHLGRDHRVGLHRTGMPVHTDADRDRPPDQPSTGRLAGSGRDCRDECRRRPRAVPAHAGGVPGARRGIRRVVWGDPGHVRNTRDVADGARELYDGDGCL